MTRSEFIPGPKAATGKLRILHVTEASCAGVGAHLLDLAEESQRLGHVTHVVYSDLRIDDLFAKRIEHLQCAGTGRVTMRRLPHWTDWSAKSSLVRYIDRHGPFDIIHGHSTKAGGLTRLKSIARSGHVVYTPHSIFTMNPSIGRGTFAVTRWIEKRLATRASALIAVSMEERHHMIEIGLPAEKIHYIPNGLRAFDWPKRTDARNRLEIPQDAITIGFLGRLAAQKNPLLMIDSFARLRPPLSHPLRLLMVGTGPLESAARRLAEKLRIADRVMWLGYRTAVDAMPTFDIFAMPSRYEGMPYVLMEAVSAGVPVVATRVGGATRSIDHGRNGFLVPVDDSPALVESLQRLVDNPALRNEFASVARGKSVEFRFDRMVAATLELYCQLVASRGPKMAANQSTNGLWQLS